MSKFSNTIQYSLKTTLDSTGITKLQNELRNTENEIRRLHSLELLGSNQTKEAITQIKTIENALTKAFNPNLGMLDSRKLGEQLKAANLSIQGMYKSFSLAGTQGQMAFNNLIGTFGKVDTGLKSISKTTDKIFNTIGNTVRWGVVASGFQGIMNAAHDAVNYVKELDRSLTDIMMVTEYSKEQMNEYARSANEAAKSLGSTTVAMTDATLVFAQQGFDLPESSALAERSTKLANASQQQTAVTSDQITAMMNAYGIEDDIAAIDKSLNSWAEVANVSAADVKEIAIGFQKAGSTAATVGVSMDQLNAQIAAIESVTREAPENIGNGLKTLYARFADIGMGETLEDGVDLGQVTNTLNEIGVEVLNAEGKMNSVGDIMEDLMAVWQTLDMTQKNAIATTLAGKYQLSRFEALMNRSDLYNEYKNSSENAEDTLNVMNEKYINSLQGRINQLQASFEGIVLDVLDTDDFYDIIGALTETVNLFDDLIEAIGGSGQALTAFGTVATRVFSKNIAAGITNVMQNAKMRNTRESNVTYNQNMLRAMGAQGDFENNKRSKKLLNQVMRSTANDDVLTVEQLEARNQLLKENVQAENKLLGLETELEQKVKATTLALQLSGDNINEEIIKQQANGRYDFTAYDKALDLESFNEIIDSTGVKNNKVLTGIRNELLKTQESTSLLFDTVAQGGQDMSEVIFKSAHEITGLARSFDNLAAQEGKTPQVLNDEILKLTNIVGDLTREINKGSEASAESIQKIIEKYQIANQEVLDFIEAARNGEILRSGVEGRKLQSNTEDAETQANALGEQLKGAIDQGETQARIQKVIDATAAIGQLGFAIESFHSLGGIWENDDITEGEKVQQTLLNLSMTLPMVLSGVTELQASWKKSAVATALVTKADELREQAAAKAAIAQQAEGKAALFAGTSSRIAATAVSGLSKVMTALGGPIGIAMMALSAFSLIVGNIQEHDKALKDAEYEKAESMREAANAAVESTKNWDALNATYQETGKVTEEFKEESLKVAEELGVQGAAAMAAAEQWNALAYAIEETKNKKIDDAIQANNAVLQGQNRKSLLGEEAFNGSLKDDSQKAYRDTGASSYVTGAMGEVQEVKDSYINGIIKDYSDLDKKDIAGIINRTKENIKALADEEERLNAIPEQDRGEEWEKQSEAVRKATDAMVELSQQEDALKYDEALQSNADYAASSASFQNALSEAETLQDMMKVFSEDENVGQVFNYLTDDAEKYAYMLEHTNDELAQQKILLAQAKDTALEYSQKLNKDANEGSVLVAGANSSLDGKMFQWSNEADNSRYGTTLSGGVENTFNHSWNDYITQQMEKATSSMTDEQAIEFYGTLNEAKTQQEFATIVEQAAGNIPTPEVEVHGTLKSDNLTNRFEETDESIENTLKESGMSETAFARMSGDAVNNNEALAKSQKEVNEAFEEGRISANEQADALADISKTGESLTARNIRLNKGVEDLVNNWEEVSAVLKDDASKGTADYYEALDTLDKAMSNILDIDMGTLSNDFYENADAMAAMEAAANGDMSAIDTLRQMAAEDIIMHMEVQNISAEDYAALQQQLLSELQGFQDLVDANSGITITPEMDTSGLLDHLNQLLANCQITAEQATAILSSMGMEGQIEYEEGETEVQEVAYRISSNPFTATGSMQSPRLTNGGTELVPQDFSWTFPEITMEPYYTPVKKPIQIPKLVGATYSGKGVASVGKKSSGGTKKGSGGKKGGSGGKSYTPKSKEKIKEKVDRYEKVNTQLEDVENTLSRINKEQERTTGFELGDNLNKQNNLLEKQLNLTKQKYEIQKQEAKELRNELSKDFGVTFDGEGFINNYAQTLKGLEGNVNSLIDQYNKATTEDAQEKLEKKIESAQKKLDDFKELYQRYDTLWGTELRQSEEAIEDLKDAIEDLRIEAFKTATEVVDNIKDLNESMTEFDRAMKNIKSLDNNNPFDNAADSLKNLGYYFDDTGKKADNFYKQARENAEKSIIEANKEKAAAEKELQKAKTEEDKRVAQEKIQDAKQKIANAQANKKFYDQAQANAKFGESGSGYLDMVTANRELILKQLDQYEKTGTSDIFGENSSALYDTAKEILQQSQDMMKDFSEQAIKLRDDIIDMVDDIAERVEERSQLFDNITDDLDYYYDMIEKINGDEDFSNLNNVLDNRINNRQQQIKLLQEAISAAEIELKNATDPKVIKEIKEKITEYQSEIHDHTLENIDDAQTKAENGVKAVTKAWEQAILNMPKAEQNGGLNNAIPGINKDIDWMQTEWELINRNADYYLDDVNAAYETQKLQNKYLDLLEETQGGSLAIQNKISDQMKQQLEYLREKKNISEYDIAYATAQLEILQKQIALEEAQQAKKQMRLRRDSQGNYRYQYVANDNDTRDAENDLLDAQNNAYNLSKEQMKQTQADSLSALQQAKQAIQDVWNNANLTIEEKQARTKYLLDNLKEYIAGTSEQLGESEKNIINDFIGMAEILVDENKDRLQDVYQNVIDGNIAAFDQIDTRWSTSLTDWLYNIDQFNSTTDEFYKELVSNGLDYESKVDEITGLVKEDYDNIADSINSCADATSKLVEENQKFINQLREDAGVVNEYNQTLSDYQAKIADVSNEMGKYQQEVARLNNIIKEKEAENAALAPTASGSGSGSGGSSSSGGNNSFAGTNYSKGALVEGIAGNIWTYGSWGNGSTRLSRLKAKFGAADGATIYAGVQTLFNGKPAYGYNYNPDKWQKEGYSYYKKFDYSKFDTGGYTGSWNDKTGQDKNGKFALLHQKELVLNAKDTENMLKVIQLVRSITTDLKNQMINSTSGFLGKNIPFEITPQELEQKVQIDATFPNVKDASEIEQALLGLTDQASQYALRFR